MIIKNICVYNMYPAILGIRNALKSKDKSDSIRMIDSNYVNCVSYNHCIIGSEDEKLIKKLLKGKIAHQERKFMRQILISMDIKGPLYWWKHFDTYKVGIVANSESTMHTLLKRTLCKNDFVEGVDFQNIIRVNKYIINKDFINANRNLPHSYLQERHITCNYENILNIYTSRKYHKLEEWKEFCRVIRSLPYFGLLIEKEVDK